MERQPQNENAAFDSNGYLLTNAKAIDGTRSEEDIYDEEENEDGDEFHCAYKFKSNNDHLEASGMSEYLKLDLHFADNELNSTYNISERVRQLNEELTQEPPIILENRSCKIRFKENLIYSAAQPSEHQMDDDLELNAKIHHEMVDSYESDRHQSQPFRITDKEGIGKNKNMEDRNVQSNTHTREGSMTNSVKEDLNEKVVIERNGNFEVVAVKDLSQEERKIYANGSLNSEAAKSIETSNVEPLTAKKSTVRPGMNSAIGGLEKSSQGKSPAKFNKNKDFHERKLKPANEKLANGSSSTTSRFNNHMRKEKENVEDRSQKQKQDSSEHFQNWLERKKKDEREKRERFKKDNKENDDKQKEESEEAYNKWKVEKERQLQRERKMKDDEEKYYKSQCETHTATECERNYKRWLIAKRQEAKAKEEQRHQKIKVYSLLIRQSQNSGNPWTNGVQGNSLYLDYHTLKF